MTDQSRGHDPIDGRGPGLFGGERTRRQRLGAGSARRAPGARSSPPSAPSCSSRWRCCSSSTAPTGPRSATSSSTRATSATPGPTCSTGSGSTSRCSPGHHRHPDPRAAARRRPQLPGPGLLPDPRAGHRVHRRPARHPADPADPAARLRRARPRDLRSPRRRHVLGRHRADPVLQRVHRRDHPLAASAPCPRASARRPGRSASPSGRPCATPSSRRPSAT